MVEYIEREALKNDIANSTEPFNTESVFRAINRQPAADVAPMRHGYWVIDDYNTRECHCSECDWPAPRDAYGYHREQTGYCHVCGAEMELGD